MVSFAIQVFDKRWLCGVTREAMSLITEGSQLDDVTGPDIEWDLDRNSVGITREIIAPEHDSLVHLLNHGSTITADQLEDPDELIGDLMQVRLCSADIAEIAMMGGNVNIVRSADIDLIYSQVESYIAEVEYNRVYTAHFVMPPVENMAAFENLLPMLRRSSHMSVASPVTDGVFGKIGSSAATVRKHMTLSAVSPSKDTADISVFDRATNPYDFKF